MYLQLHLFWRAGGVVVSWRWLVKCFLTFGRGIIWLLCFTQMLGLELGFGFRLLHGLLDLSVAPEKKVRIAPVMCTIG